MSSSRWWAMLVLSVMLVACSSPAEEDPSAFCALLRDASLGSSGVASVDLDDGTSVQAAIEELESLVAEAPEAVLDEVTVVSEIYAEALTALANTAPGARDDVLRELQPRLDSAADPATVLEQYGAQTCNVVFEGPEAPTPTPTPVDVDD